MNSYGLVEMFEGDFADTSEMRIVASMASMLEEPTRENEEQFWI